MPTISRVIRGRVYECRPADNGVYYIFWSENRRSRRQSTRAKDVADAQAFFDEWCRLTEEHATAPQRSLLCADIFDAAYHDCTDRVRFAWKHLAPHYGQIRPIDVSDDTDAKYIAARRAEKAAASTIRFELATLRASWRRAVQQRILRSEDLPVLKKLPEGSPPRSRWLSDEEIQALEAGLDAAPRRIRLFGHIALHTAARRTAIQNLRWSQVDFDLGIVNFLPPGERQTRKRRAAVPMSEKLRAVLYEAYLTRTDDFVIGAGGKVNDPLKSVAIKAGVKGVTPHVLRHTAGTRLARSGVSLWLIAKILGDTIETVEKNYAHYQPGMAREAVEILSRRTA